MNESTNILEIPETKIQRLCMRLHSDSMFDIPLIIELSNNCGLPLPDFEKPFLLEVWQPCIQGWSSLYEVSIVLNKKIIAMALVRD